MSSTDKEYQISRTNRLVKRTVSVDTYIKVIREKHSGKSYATIAEENGVTVDIAKQICNGSTKLDKEDLVYKDMTYSEYQEIISKRKTKGKTNRSKAKQKKDKELLPMNIFILKMKHGNFTYKSAAEHASEEFGKNITNNAVKNVWVGKKKIFKEDFDESIDMTYEEYMSLVNKAR